jgi:two-component system nitrate/nitrite response regulator NarL
LTIVIADVDAILTEYLSSMLERNGHRVLISVPAHAAVRDAVRAIGPDLCLLDLALRDGANLTDLRRLVAENPDTAVVVRTADPSVEQMQAALAAGAAGYVHKSRGAMVLLDALTRVADGEVVVEGVFTRTAAVADESPEQAYRSDLVRRLTPRERECLVLLGDGSSTRAMAAELGVSITTVRSHVQALLGKLGVHSRLEAAAIARRCNLDPEVAPPPGDRARVVRLSGSAGRPDQVSRRHGSAGRA